MSAYYDEDDLDYDDNVPEFQDEAEFDDYLNDEEYQLMNDIFPKVVAELADYQGWDNLSVKLAIFDHNFAVDEALIDLKRRYKKKEPKQRKLSALELLARKRSEGRKKAEHDGGPSKTSSLLDRLKSTHRGDGVKVSRLPNNQGSSSNGLGDGSHVASKSHVLASKLASFRNKKAVADEQLIATEATVPKESAHVDEPSSIAKRETENHWELLNQMKNSPSLGKAIAPAKPNRLSLSEVIVNKSISNGLKRSYEETNSVFYPNTNNETVKKQAIANFSQPSPDDVVLNQQKNAFEVENVKKKVASLSLSDKLDEKASTDQEKEQCSVDEEDDEKSPFEEQQAIRTYKKVTVPTKPKKNIEITSFLKDRKPHLNFVVLGHVDAGKSTLMGRLLYDVGAVDTKLIRKLQKESEIIGKSSFHLAWVMDQTAEERNRGVTVDICTSDFETSTSTFTIVDAPGHRDFVPNAIVGISQADVAVLSVDCGTNAFESGFNLDGQTKEHTLLARSLGIKHIVVAMNKMDTVQWYEGRFSDIKLELGIFFEEIGYKSENISWVPCSGLTGEGIFKTDYPAGQTWYQGPNLVGELDRVSKLYGSIDESVMTESFLFNILDVTPTSKNTSAIISGKVEQGSIQPGETITIYPSEQSCVVDSILSGNDGKKVDIALHGDFVQLKLHNAFFEDIQCGDLAAIVGYDIPSAQEFTARLLTFKLDRPLLPGTSLMLFRGSTEQPARIKKLCQLVDKTNPSKILKKKVKHLASQQSAIVEIELIEKKRRMPMLTFEQNKKLGRVVIRKEGKTIGAALINSLDY